MIELFVYILSVKKIEFKILIKIFIFFNNIYINIISIIVHFSYKILFQ